MRIGCDHCCCARTAVIIIDWYHWVYHRWYLCRQLKDLVIRRKQVIAPHRILRYTITYPSLRYLLLAPKSSFFYRKASTEASLLAHHLHICDILFVCFITNSCLTYSFFSPTPAFINHISFYKFNVWWNCCASTVYPKKYAHGFCFAVLCCGYTLTDLPISIRLTSLALWQSNDCPSASKATLMNMDKYFMWIHYERLHNHNKAKHNKTVCIFLGIYCTVINYPAVVR